MHDSLDNLIRIEKEIQLKVKQSNLIIKEPKIIAVSKNFMMPNILPLITHGHIDFGENRVQEAISKWSDLKDKTNEVKLHMIGKLQTNKVKYVIPLFDYIHTLDNLRLAEKISEEQLKINKNLKIFIQVNIGRENQKSGILIEELDTFYDHCTNNLSLNIIGLMCLPPNDNNPTKYFSKLFDLTKKLKIKELSMGMSNDYLDAVETNSTYLRIGSKIFGNRG
jgi:pyridoxal phosphate enzyme (YggS family)